MKRFVDLKIGTKLITIMTGLSLVITIGISVIVYIISSNSIRSEATDKLAASAELKTNSIVKFLEDRYGDIHVLTGTDIIVNTSSGLIKDINNSLIPSGISIVEKRKYLERNSNNYRLLKQYVDKNIKALPNFSEIKIVAIFPITNIRGEIVFKQGDQILSANDFDGNVKDKTMFTGGYDLILRKSDGVETDKYNCSFLYSSSIEWCSELKKSSIHMSHGLHNPGLSMDQLRRSTPVSQRFSTMMIFDVNTESIDKLLHDTAGMGETGESYMIEKINNEIIMLTDSRFEKGTALKRKLTSVKGLQEHLKRNEYNRGTGYCQNTEYADYRGNKVLSHNHMVHIGKHEVGLITEIDYNEVFAAVSKLLRYIVGIVIFVIIASVIVAVFFSRTIANPISYAVEFAKVVASGNFTQNMDKEYLQREDEIGELASAMSKMSIDLESVIANIIVAAQNLVQAVQEIASGNENLSQRTSEQASSLEEIASTMEESTANINQNAENATHADKLASGTLSSGEEGGQVVSDAVAAINEISDSSKKIEEIISVIDEIAFQTNLLALNAAVEAARAGEQGRGFAVVAGEVRNLAQRSGNAAKEISELIKDSMVKVTRGTDLANKSGESLKDIIDSIKEVAKYVSEIAAASDEQRQGAQQINTAIEELDSMTQQNAGLVEETASASEEMSNQAQELLSMMERFKIRNDLQENVYSSKHKEVHLKQVLDNSNNSVKKNGNENKLDKALSEEGFEEF